MDALLQFDDVSFHYADGTRALERVTFAARARARTVLLGRNGSGKSTLLHLADGLLKPSAGRVLFDGHTLGSTRPDEARSRARVGLVFQESDHQIFSASVEQDVSFGAFNLGWDRSRVERETRHALDVTGCTPFRERPVHALSGGQKKRVAIAGVIVMGPDLILADEPTAHLDPEGQDGLIDLFDALHRAGKTFLVATMDVGFARAWFDHAVVLDGGRVVASGPAREIAGDGPLLKRHGLWSRHMRGNDSTGTT